MIGAIYMSYFITLEGVEGSGKSTLINFIRDSIESNGKKVVVTREPGGIDIAEQIRSVILDKKILKWMVEQKPCFTLLQEDNI